MARSAESSPPSKGLRVAPGVEIPAAELDFSAVRAQGAGGQNVNKVSSAVHLRFDIAASQSLPEPCRARLLCRRDQRITSAGVVVIKAQQHRSQDKNKAAALERLRELVADALVTPKARKPTAPPRGARLRRLDDKARRGRLKRARSTVDD